MRPKTSVRKPIIAGARRQQLSDLLRAWRSQPRTRSPVLFWALFTLALVLDIALACLSGQLLGLAESAPATPAGERRMFVPYARNLSLWEPLRRWAIRVDGWPQLFESFCRDAVYRVTGEERFEGREALAVVVSWMLHNAAWEDYPFLRCDDAALRALLYHHEQPHGSYVEPAVLRRAKKFRNLLRDIAAKEKGGEAIQLTSLERHAAELNDRLAFFDRIHSVGVDGGDGEEMATARAALAEAYLAGNADLFAAALNDFLIASRRALRVDEDPSVARRLAWECWHNEYRPVRWAMYFSLLATGLLAAAVMMRGQRPRRRRGLLLSGLWACIICLGWSIAEIVCQAVRCEGWPIDDGTQGVLWVSFFVLSLALALSLWERDVFIALAGALLGSVGFVLANRWPPMFAANWTPLPDGDNWQRLQVLTLLSAFAALALSGSAAAFGLARMTLTLPSAERQRGLAALCARPLGIAVVLLTASAALDGFRALGSSDSWHGWSTQAVGTLLALPGCVLVLHARRAGWIRPLGMMMLTAVGCSSMAMVWHTAATLGAGERCLADSVFVYAAGLLSFSLAAHAALRYYFGKQPILEG